MTFEDYNYAWFPGLAAGEGSTQYVRRELDKLGPHQVQSTGTIVSAAISFDLLPRRIFSNGFFALQKEILRSRVDPNSKLEWYNRSLLKEPNRFHFALWEALIHRIRQDWEFMDQGSPQGMLKLVALFLDLGRAERDSALPEGCKSLSSIVLGVGK
jgi:hypothetical protein